MGIPSEVRDAILVDKEGLTQTFHNHLQDIFSCTKHGFTSFCEQFDQDNLSILRDSLFAKLCENNSNYADKEICQRRKKKPIINDIYILGYSLINQLEDKGMKGIIKTDKTGDCSILNNSEHVIEDNTLLQICTM